MEEKIKVLILEDLPSDAELAERELKTVLNNYKIVVTDTEQGFIKALENFKPDLIISDYMLPAFNGMKALQITRKKEEFIPFIILTGSMNEETAVECMKAGADDYVIKEGIQRLGPAVLSALDNKKIRQERKQAEDKLQESEENYRLIFESTGTATLIVDKHTTILQANNECGRIFGYSPKKLVGTSWINYVYKEDLPDMLENTKLRIKDPSLVPSKYEVRLINANEEIRNAILSIGFIPESKRSIVSMIDITERKQAEKLLGESEAKFKSYIENATDGIFIANEKGKNIEVNKAACEITGYSEDELLNLTIPDLIQEKYLGKAKKHFQTVVEHGFATGEMGFSTKSGEKKFWNVDTVKLSETRFLGFTKDITKQKQAEARLLKLSTAVQQSSSIIAITNTNGNFEYVNPKFSEITGYSFKELIGQKSNLLKSGEQPIEFYTELWDTITAGKAWRGEFHNKKKNGELFCEMASISPIFDEQGKIVNYIKVAEDITERKQAEENFKNSIDESPLGIRIVNKAGETIYVNKALLDIYEFSSLNEFINTKSIERYTEQSYQEHQERKKIRHAGGDASEYEISIRRKNGEIRHIKVWRKEVIWNREKHFQVINQDVTELKRLNTDLILALEKAQESDRLKSAFLANMSHEIRTPMNGILGFTELLKEPHLTGDEREEFIDVIEQSGHRMLDTINDIVNISKIEAGQVKVVKTEVSVNHILKEQYHFFQPEAKAKGLELIYLPCMKDDEARIVTDQHKLEGILTNLIKNAIKYTKKGSITFGCKLKKEKDIKSLEFYVKDTGIGIPENRIDAIFNRFEQADIADTRAFQGSGLGLAISKSYAEMLGGEIGVSSKEGSGSTFTFSIPYNKQNLKISGAIQNKEEESGISLKNLSVIIAEDDETSRMFLETIFKNQVKGITYTTTGKETIEKFRENRDTDIILMDIQMPDMNGYDATREIRKFNNNVVIIAQTAFALSGDSEKAIKAGCNDYIAKPIEKDLLFEKIRACLDKKAFNKELR